MRAQAPWRFEPWLKDVACNRLSWYVVYNGGRDPLPPLAPSPVPSCPVRSGRFTLTFSAVYSVRLF